MSSLHFQVVVLNAIHTFGTADQTCPTVLVALYSCTLQLWRLYCMIGITFVVLLNPYTQQANGTLLHPILVQPKGILTRSQFLCRRGLLAFGHCSSLDCAVISGLGALELYGPHQLLMHQSWTHGHLKLSMSMLEILDRSDIVILRLHRG